MMERLAHASLISALALAIIHGHGAAAAGESMLLQTATQKSLVRSLEGALTGGAAEFEALAEKHRATMARWQEEKSDKAEKSKVFQDVQESTLLEQRSGSFTANATPILNATPSRGNASYHNSKSSHHQSILDENITRCQECSQAEQALIESLTEAVSAHSLSEGEAHKLAAATDAYDVASLLAAQAEGWKQGNKSLMDSEQSVYMTVAAAALEADQHVTLKRSEVESACGHLPTSSPTAAPAAAPTPAPTPAPTYPSTCDNPQCPIVNQCDYVKQEAYPVIDINIAGCFSLNAVRSGGLDTGPYAGKCHVTKGYSYFVGPNPKGEKVINTYRCDQLQCCTPTADETAMAEEPACEITCQGYPDVPCTCVPA